MRWQTRRHFGIVPQRLQEASLCLFKEIGSVNCGRTGDRWSLSIRKDAWSHGGVFRDQRSGCESAFGAGISLTADVVLLHIAGGKNVKRSVSLSEDLAKFAG